MARTAYPTEQEQQVVVLPAPQQRSERRLPAPPPKAQTTVGRPPKFSDPLEMEAAIQEYFRSCWSEKRVETFDSEGNRTIEFIQYQAIPYTMAGLARSLGMSTSTLRAYGQDGITLATKSWEENVLQDDDPRRPEFTALVARARADIEEFCERQCHEGRNASTVFNLMQCNFGYRMPKQEVEVNQNTTLNPAVHNDRAKRTREAMLAQLAASPIHIARATERGNTEDAT